MTLPGGGGNVSGMWHLLLLLACTPKDPADDTADSKDSEEPGESGETGEPAETGDTSGYDAETVPLDGICADEVHQGEFRIDANEDYAYVTGSVANGVVPATILTELESSGGCTIWRKENPFCDPTCDPGYTCDFDGTCVRYPEGQELGTVNVYGLLEPVSMEPVVPGYEYFNTSVPNPPWTAGGMVRLSSTGGVFEPFTLYGVGPDDLTMASSEWVVTSGEPLALSWTPPTTTTRTQVRATLQIDQHGTTPSTVVCWFEDDGEAEIPAEILEVMTDLGISGFPNGSVMRLTVDSTEVGEGCADLWLTSSRVPTVSITGYTPCTRDGDCPEGQECNEEMERCE